MTKRHFPPPRPGGRPTEIFSKHALSRNDAVKTSKFDRIYRIYRMGKKIEMRNNASPFGEGF